MPVAEMSSAAYCHLVSRIVDDAHAGDAVPLIDDFMPAFDAVERHALTIAAPPAVVYGAISRVDFARSRPIRWLLRMRGLGTRGRLTLGDVTRRGFVLLAERPGSEMLFGIAGRFWTPSGGRVTLDPDGFRRFERAGYAKAVWDFRVADAGHGSTRLTTETRIRCVDSTARRRFRVYWAFVRPFSGLIRILMLRAVARQAR
jgi:hypothetical protein